MIATKTQHTPGPWRWSDEYQARDLTDTWSLLGKDGYGILSCDGKCNSPLEANKADAHLIAAAPDLLEAIKGILNLLDSGMNGSKALTETLADARAAIAKATGVKGDTA